MFNYYVLFVIGFSGTILIIRSVVLKGNDNPVKLFAEALRKENNRQLEDAITTYENALNEVKKVRYHNSLKNKITEKLKVLHTNIDYRNGFYIIAR